jgi:hypothetical protein
VTGYQISRLISCFSTYLWLVASKEQGARSKERESLEEKIRKRRITNEDQEHGGVAEGVAEGVVEGGGKQDGGEEVAAAAAAFAAAAAAAEEAAAAAEEAALLAAAADVAVAAAEEAAAVANAAAAVAPGQVSVLAFASNTTTFIEVDVA